MRPFAMAAPNANVYVEVGAPDLRFAVALLVAAAVALLWRRRTGGQRSPAVLALFIFTALAFVPWMMTSGNGRYFVAVLLLAGPLVAGLIHVLPLTKAFRLFLMAGTVVAQITVISLNSPWGSWAWLNWQDAPYFQVDAPEATVGEPVTYVGLSSISYSLIAPQFPPDARWINIASGGATPRDSQWVREFIASADRRILVVPSVSAQTAQGQPTQEVRDSLNELLAPHQMALTTQPCQVRPSRGLASIGLGKGVAAAKPEVLAKFSFWLCPLSYPVPYQSEQEPALSVKVEGVFARLEQKCPRFFRPGEGGTRRIKGGAMRQYPGSDMKAYVLDDGAVMYKFWRALNPVLVGRVDDILRNGPTIECDRIRGRAGLPWEREI